MSSERGETESKITWEFPAYEFASVDAFRHAAHCCGDDNPLSCDPVYAAGTRYGSVIAPPPFLPVTGVSTAKEIPPQVWTKGVSALRGVYQFFAGSQWEWLRSIKPGDRLSKWHYLADVPEKSSTFGGGLSVITHYRNDFFTDQNGRAVGTHRSHFVHTEREASRTASRNHEIPMAHYTEEDLARIDALYRAAVRGRRGAMPRYWEDVQVGDVLGPLVKGPLLISDIIAHLQAGGVTAPFEMRFKYGQRRPKFFSTNGFGVPDLLVRIHWFCHLLTEWMGDDGWLWKLSDEIRRFNFVGDLSRVSGTVTRKFADAGRHGIELALKIVNQREEQSARATAHVLLLSREHRSVRLD